MVEYNIKSGTPTKITTQHEFTTYKFHPYGLSGFRQKILNFVKEKKDKGMGLAEWDNLTDAWRSPWDMHIRYYDLMSPLNQYVTGISQQLSPEYDWYHYDSWVAEYENCSGANLHDHGNIMGWSYCYYVKVPDDGPGFMIQDGVNKELFELNVSDGDILFFRSFISHQVLPSIGNRVVIAGNLRMLDLDYQILEKDFSNYDSEDWTRRYQKD